MIWWAFRTVGVDKWIVKVIKSMYDGLISKIRVNDSYSDDISAHQGSVLSPLLFIIVLAALWSFSMQMIWWFQQRHLRY